MGKRRHVPQRSCVICREAQDKSLLVRIVRTLEGTVELDLTGKAPGRGAYLCRSEKCLSDDRKWQRIGRSLSAMIGAPRAEALERELQALQRGLTGAATEAK